LVFISKANKVMADSSRNHFSDYFCQHVVEYLLVAFNVWAEFESSFCTAIVERIDYALVPDFGGLACLASRGAHKNRKVAS
jgi:hypothetical protein